MIFRISTGRAGSPEDADRYATFLDTTVLPELRTLPGHRGACLLRRELDLLIVTRWESLDAIRAFRGRGHRARGIRTGSATPATQPR